MNSPRWMPKLRLNFRQRLFLGIALLLSAAMTVAGIAVSLTLTERVRQNMDDQLHVGVGVVAAQLESRAAQLDNSVGVLTSDFGFISAVATGDSATVASALNNHGERIGADFLLLTDVDGHLRSASDASFNDGVKIPFPSVLAQAQRAEQAYAVVEKNGNLYQLFLKSVKAPNPIAWVYMAFALDSQEASRMAALTGLDVSFVSGQAGEAPQDLVSTISEQNFLSQLGTKIDALDFNNDDIFSVGGTHRTIVHRLDTNSDAPLFTALHTSMAQIGEAQQELLTQLSLIMVVTLGLCLLVSSWLARQMSNPISTLIKAAKRIRQGDYSEPVEVVGGGEMGLLGGAINTMVSGIAEREQRIHKLAYHDGTTGAPNKMAFMESYESKLDATQTADDVGSPRKASAEALRQEGFALCLFSLVNAREISFSLGFDNGEKLMQSVLARLRGEIRDEDDLYAFRADQYAMVIPGVTAAQATKRVEMLVEKLSGNYELGEWTVSGFAAAAIVSYPEDADDITTLLRRAEVTLDQSIQAGRDVQVYVPGQEDSVARRLHIIADFDKAISGGQFGMVFQPKVDIATSTVANCEALIRWIHPDLGFIPPDEFIQLAEQSGKIHKITDFVLDTAIAQAVQWHSQLNVRVAINLSARDIGDPNLHTRVSKVMERHGATGDMICLEVTESSVLADAQAAIVMLERLKRLGIKLSIDDYGTGYSSLSQLKNLPVDELKIDMAFVLKMDECAEDAMIVKSTVDLGHNLDLSVVAEGVENEASLSLLKSYGCDTAQGYFFAKPMPALEFEQWCTNFRKHEDEVIEQHG